MERRIQRVAELLKQQLSIMIKESLPEDLGIVTVTTVEVSGDIKNATVYVSCLEKTREREILKKLEEKIREFQHILGRNLKLRYTPKLTYKFDRSLEQINRVEEILEDLNKDKK